MDLNIMMIEAQAGVYWPEWQTPSPGRGAPVRALASIWRSSRACCRSDRPVSFEGPKFLCAGWRAAVRLDRRGPLAPVAIRQWTAANVTWWRGMPTNGAPVWCAPAQWRELKRDPRTGLLEAEGRDPARVRRTTGVFFRRMTPSLPRCWRGVAKSADDLRAAGAIVEHTCCRARATGRARGDGA